ncbi:hypothetical protein [Thalassotalea aquiviva]|uniref:hypothetical protein n=1 Tax=Thalassotalea aquiviva TaxID=3242415 RepID=UPI00352A5819
MAHDLLSDTSLQTTQFLELCNAMYERELGVLAENEFSSTKHIQSRLQSLPHYIRRTAGSMLKVNGPLALDLQNASWSVKQARSIPIKEQSDEQVLAWYQKNPVSLGLIVPVLLQEQQKQRIILDCVDRVLLEQEKFRTNQCGWFYYHSSPAHAEKHIRLLKPNLKVLAAACSGHQWLGEQRTNPTPLSLRELLLSCQINWPNLKKPLPAKA